MTTPKPLTADEIAEQKSPGQRCGEEHTLRLIATIEQQAEQIEKLQADKREIENAAFERVAKYFEDRALEFPRSTTGSAMASVYICESNAIRSFIQPPAQKEDRE